LSTRPGRALLLEAVPSLLFVALLIISFANPLFLRRNFAGRDLLAYNLPMEKSIHDAYARGRLPVWSPSVSGGRPLLPNPNGGALYPLRPLLSAVSFPVAMRIFPILHWAAAGIGTILLMRLTGASRSAAWISSCTYVFSGVVMSDVFFPHIQPGMALLPWILFVLRRPFLRAGNRTILLGLLFGLDMLAGDVFTTALAIGCGALWIVMEESPASRPSGLLRLSFGIALGVLLALPQIAATALWIPETNRAVFGMKLEEVLLYSVSPWRLLELVVPYPFGPAWTIDDTGMWAWPIFRGKLTGLFISLYAGALAVVALVETRKADAVGRRFAQALLGLSLALAVVPSLVPDSWRALPAPLPLRNPEKIAVVATLALAILAGIATDRLRAAPRVPRWTLAVAAGLAAAAVLVALLPQGSGRLLVRLVGSPPEAASRAALHTPRALAEAGLLWMATVVALALLRRPQAGARIAALALLTAVPFAANRRIARSFRQEEVFSPPAFVRFLEKQDPQGRFRTLGESMYRAPSRLEGAHASGDPGYLEFARNNWYQHSHVLWERGTVFNGDFDVGDLARLESLRRISTSAVRFLDSAEFFRSLSLRWGIRNRDDAPIAGYRRVGGDTLHEWDELDGALPEIRLARGWKEEIGSVAALQALPRLAPGEIVIETGRRRTGAGRPGRLRILEDRPEHLVIQVESPDPAWLFVLRGFWNYQEFCRPGARHDHSRI
jgi:hypothetical protein